MNEQEKIPPEDLGAGQADIAMIDPKNEKDIVGEIGSRLGERIVEKKKEADDKPKAEEPLQFDIEKLNPEQLQLLKQRLAVTPDRAVQNKANTTTTIRVMGGKYIVSIKSAYLALVYDATRLAEVETLKIPVRFAGEDKYTDVIYPDFMKADRVPCEILSMRKVLSYRNEGEVVQRETGKLVAREATIVNYFYTIKLPDGTTVEVDDLGSNA